MKKNICLFLASVLLTCTVKAQWFVGSRDVNDDTVVKFGVISDTHFENNTGEGAMSKVPRALKNLSSHGPLDALFDVGDITNNGDPEQYKMLVSVFGNDDNFMTRVERKVFMMATGHDNFNANGYNNSTKGLAPFNGGKDYPTEQFLDINGYPFITISQRNTSLEGRTYITSVRNQLKAWLEKADKEYPGKPIFVFTHVPPTNTCYGTWNGEGSWCSGELNAILNDYPQIILFAGHSHFPVADPRSIHQGVSPNSSYQNYYTVVNTGSTTYGEIEPGAVDEGIHPSYFANITEGLIVSVKKNGDVLIQRYDTYRDEEIGAANRWLIEAPHDGSRFKYADIRDIQDVSPGQTYRTGLPAPEWDSSVTEPDVVHDIESEALRVTFPQAHDEEYVFRYKISLKSPYGRLIASRHLYSYAYLNSETPKKLSINLDCSGQPDGQYTVVVAALDAYGNASERPLEKKVDVKATSPTESPKPTASWDFEDAKDLLKNSVSGSPYFIQTGTCSSKSYKLQDITMTHISGPASDDKAVTLKAGDMFKMVTPVKGNITSYTLLWYVRVTDATKYHALLQTYNNNDHDANLFINRSGQVGRGANYGGQVKANTWHRIIFSVKDKAGTVYLDGAPVAKMTGDEWCIHNGHCLIFADEDGEYTDIDVAQLTYWDRPLTIGEVKALQHKGSVLETSTPEVEVYDDELSFDLYITSSAYPTFEFPDWIHPQDAPPGIGVNLKYTFRCDPLPKPDTRTGVITVKTDEKDVTPLRINVIQTQREDILGNPSAQWDFNDSDNPLANCVKSSDFTMQPVTTTGRGNVVVRKTLEEAGLSFVPGPEIDQQALKIPKNSGLRINHPMRGSISTYTIVYDMLYTSDSWVPLIQTAKDNGNDGDVFIKGETHNIGLSGWYGGYTRANTWHRIAIVVKDGAPTAYLDGTKTGGTSASSRFVIDPGYFFVFIDEDGEDSEVHLSRISFWLGDLTDGQIKKLGKIE